jgi:hypothetical protein
MVEIAGLLLVAAIGWYVAWPLLSPSRTLQETTTEGPLADLEARRETLYREIADLDFDHSLGKIDDEDYRLERSACVSEAADVLAELESVNARSRPDHDERIARDQDLEEEIRRLREGRAP